MSVTLKDAGLRKRDVIGSVAVIAVVALLGTWSALAARATAKKTSPRLRICAVAARPLPAGTMLREEDVSIRIRRIDPEAQYFDRSEQLAGRQIREDLDPKDVERNQVLTESMLTESCLEREVTFFIVVDGVSAACLRSGDQVILTRAGKTDAVPTMPIFTVVGVNDVLSADKTKVVADQQIELRAKFAADAMRVFAAAGDAPKFIPLRLERLAPESRPPAPASPAPRG